MVFTGAWKGAGYFAVLFLAAIVGIDQSIYESAAIDGESRLRQMFYITLPNIVPTMKVVAMLSVMALLRNFDQIFVMGNASIYDKVRNLLYLIYNEGIIKFRIGPATAAATLVLLATLIITFAVRKLIRYDETYD
jgi:putative aldouronate transport system permease protein